MNFFLDKLNLAGWGSKKENLAPHSRIAKALLPDRCPPVMSMIRFMCVWIN